MASAHHETSTSSHDESSGDNVDKSESSTNERVINVLCFCLLFLLFGWIAYFWDKKAQEANKMSTSPKQKSVSGSNSDPLFGSSPPTPVQEALDASHENVTEEFKASGRATPSHATLNGLLTDFEQQHENVIESRGTRILDKLKELGFNKRGWSRSKDLSTIYFLGYALFKKDEFLILRAAGKDSYDADKKKFDIDNDWKRVVQTFESEEKLLSFLSTIRPAVMRQKKHQNN